MEVFAAVSLLVALALFLLVIGLIVGGIMIKEPVFVFFLLLLGIDCGGDE